MLIADTGNRVCFRKGNIDGVWQSNAGEERREMDFLDKVINMLKDGAKRVDFQWNGHEVSAYWVGHDIRIDIKGLR